MFKKLNILDEKEKILRETAKEVNFPLTKILKYGGVNDII